MLRRSGLAALLVVPVGLLASLDPPRDAPRPASAHALPVAPAAEATPPLQAALDSIIRRSSTGVVRGVIAVSLDHGDTLYARGADVPLAPASNMKLLTTAAALVHLGPEFRFATFLLTDGHVADSVLYGNVYIYGTGDPTLGTRFAPRPSGVLYAFADTLAALGIREIRGDVVGDGSYFRGPSTGDGWHSNNLDAWYAPTAGALSFHENLVRLEIRPGPAPGSRPAVTFVPGGDGIAVVNLGTTGGGGGVKAGRVDFGGPIVIEGSIGSGTASYATPVADPARYAAALFRDVLVTREIPVAGSIRAIDNAAESPVTGRTTFAPALGRRTGIRVLAVHTSAPLRDILHVINHQSHNFYSEQVLRTVGRIAAGEGSVRGGARAVNRLLARAGADTTRVYIADGCGLSPLNRVSPRSFAAVLSFMARSPLAGEFFETLPVAGEARRFRRMGGTPAEGNLRAKTGTIDGVSALSGYVSAANGERIAFSIISNNASSTAQAKYIENLIGARLAAFGRARPRAPAPAPAPSP